MIMGVNIYQKRFGAFLFKVLLNMNLLHFICPHQNGTAEQNWHTLFDMARSMLSKVKFACGFLGNMLLWIQHAQIIVIVTIQITHWIGCYSYIQNSKKLDAHCVKGYFVGCDDESPSYLVYFPDINSVIKHGVVKFTDEFEMRRVPFDESGFNYW